MTLQPGETKTVRFPLGPNSLRYWSAARREWVHDASEFDVWVGSDSAASVHAAFRSE